MLPLESLESPETPATYFASGTALTIADAGGTIVDQPADRALGGTAGAVQLWAGDRPVLDQDGDNVFRPYDPATGAGRDQE